MKTLLLLRHAKSSWKNTRLADHDRPLNSRGQQDAPRMGRHLLHNDLVPELIISSTAERASATAEAAALAADFQGEINYTRRLYHAGFETYVEELRRLSDQINCVMLVSHNPGMEELVEELTGSFESMPTAALAHIELPISSWGDMDEGSEGRLINVWRPKELPG